MSTTKRVPCCPKCGSADISADAASRWDIDTQQWEVTNIFDKGKSCDDCGHEFSDADWRDATPEEAAQVDVPIPPPA
jgi:hypothetical protein